jgi:hypothetical protein
MKEEIMQIIPINNGYYNYKTIQNKIIKSCCEKATYKNIRTSGDILTYANSTYIIGVGNPNLHMDKTLDEKTKILILNTLSKFVYNKKESFKLLLSTPPLSYEHQSMELPKYLIGRHNVTIGEYDDMQISIEDCVVLPETFMAYPANNFDGRYDNKILLIFDIGGFTTNVCMITQGAFSGTKDEYLTEQRGMYHIDTEISQLLNSKLPQLNCTYSDIQYFRNQGLTIDSTDKNYMDVLSKDINEIYISFFEDIITKCITKGWNIHAYNHLITGGGGQILFKTIKSNFLTKAVLGVNPLFDTLNGLQLVAQDVFE